MKSDIHFGGHERGAGNRFQLPSRGINFNRRPPTLHDSLRESDTDPRPAALRGQPWFSDAT